MGRQASKKILSRCSLPQANILSSFEWQIQADLPMRPIFAFWFPGKIWKHWCILGRLIQMYLCLKLPEPIRILSEMMVYLNGQKLPTQHMLISLLPAATWMMILKNEVIHTFFLILLLSLQTRQSVFINYKHCLTSITPVIPYVFLVDLPQSVYLLGIMRFRNDLSYPEKQGHTQDLFVRKYSES